MPGGDSRVEPGRAGAAGPRVEGEERESLAFKPQSFLNANPAPGVVARVANYGLMDQLAALHWLQQNAALFGGDPSSVTLMGHGSGAACIQFLMVSPASTPGLFHRAILLSGSALSSWALVEDPVQFAVRLAHQVNCSLPDDLLRDHEMIVDCLREAPLSALLRADVRPPTFLSAFGPSVDGVVIKHDVMRQLLTAPLAGQERAPSPRDGFSVSQMSGPALCSGISPSYCCSNRKITT
ncbi:Neuroligin-3 [Frankliniella fusca]|uniref:Neuroligin-3 n=1 Tax=Frankliniella fusca TaxID=407009 RepID=A0AAE1H0M7_9NEOP|nr:Neuroligin-3 [Frankliniella fusca]